MRQFHARALESDTVAYLKRYLNVITQSRFYMPTTSVPGEFQFEFYEVG